MGVGVGILPEIPQNTGYMIAGYCVTAFILLGYVILLYRRGKNP